MQISTEFDFDFAVRSSISYINISAYTNILRQMKHKLVTVK